MTRELEPDTPQPRDVGARVSRDLVEQFDAWARKNRWSRSAAIAAAMEMAVSSQPSATGWDNAEVRG